MPTFTIIIPAYNQARYLGETVQSIFNQSYMDYEIIVVDDGSTDETRQVAMAFSDPRVRYIHQANRGLSGARNTGLKHAQAPWVLFLDADDLLFPDTLQAHLQNLEQHPSAGMSVGGWRYVDSAGNPPTTNVTIPTIALDLVTLLHGNPIPVHSVVVAKAWFDKVGDFDESLRACEDWDVWLRLLAAGCQVAPLQHLVCSYRMHEGQMTRQPERMRTAMFRVLDKFYTHSALSADLIALKDKVYAAAHLKAAAREYHAKVLTEAKADLTAAVQLDNTLLENQAQRLREYLAGWSITPAGGDPIVYLETIYSNLPPQLSHLSNAGKGEVARAYMQRAYGYYRAAKLSEAGACIFAAIRWQPSWLCEPPVINILSRYFLYRTTGVKLIGQTQ
jgi:glycosyltransferase involved in cell wall biosynthesis